MFAQFGTDYLIQYMIWKMLVTNLEELEQGCELLDFMKENLTDEADNWAKYSQELKSPSIFFNLLDNLNLMIDEITKTIDTITA